MNTRLILVQKLCAQGFSSREIAIELDTTAKAIQGVMHRNNVKGLYRGGQPNNKSAMIHGQGKNTIMRLTKRILIACERNLHVCERCGWVDKTEELPRHHIDRDRTNNTPENLEVLCKTCHALEHIKDRKRNDLGQVI